MQLTELKIYANNLYLNVDLYDNEPIQLEKSISEISEPETRKSEFTRTIKIPGTHNNNNIFSNIFDIARSVINNTATNFNLDFNPNLKADCILLYDGQPIMRGYLQLTNIIINDYDKVDYEVVIIGRNSNIFQDMGDNKLPSLDLSEFDHIWDETNVINSWTAPIGSGYVYPIIERGFDPAEQTYYVDQTYPAVYVKSIVDAIFKKYGYSYQSNFFNTTRFKSLIMPFNGGAFRLSTADVDNRLFELTFNADTNYLTDIGQNLIAFNTISKNSSPSGVSASKFTIPTGYNGRYIFRTELKCRARYTGVPTLTNSGFIFAVLIRSTSGLRLGNIDTAIQWNNVSTNNTIDFNVTLQSIERYLEAGEQLYVEWWLLPAFGNAINSSNFEVKFLKDSAFFNSYPSGQFMEGNMINIAQALPQDMKESEFMKGLIKMFNLMIEPDIVSNKKLIIEPAIDFYRNTSINWTDKLDISNDIELMPMGALNFKELQFNWLKDDDEFNKKYNDMYFYVYGSKQIKINNDFLTEVKNIELPFAPSPLADTSTNDRVLTKIRYFNDDNTLQNKTSKPRILYYGGLVTTGLGSFYFGSRINNSLVARTTYPYAGHLDNTKNPTFDLNFDTSRTIFYGSGFNPTITNGNLYNIYWKNYINQITDKDSKIMKCKMKLTNNDISQLSFRDSYLIDRQYYILYKITKNINEDGLASCEFLKLKTQPAFILTTGKANGGVGTVSDIELPQLEYFNSIEFRDNEMNYTMPVNLYTDVVYLLPISQTIIADNNVYLPDPIISYDFILDKSIEIIIYNNHTGNIDVIDDFNGETFNVNTKKAHHYYTDGTKWYQI